jgi:YqaJ-like viral recombinase domain
MPIFDWDIDQGSLAWYKLHNTIPTASEFDKILTPKRAELAAARFRYACRIIAARIMNWQADSLDKIAHIAEGKQNEASAISQLEFTQEIETVPVGFVRTNDKRFGASPDRLSGVNADRTRANITIEAKCPTVPIQLERLLLGHDDAYRCQVNGQLFVTEADKAIFYSFHPRMPPYMVETGRDEPFIRKLRDALEQFSDELEEMTERAKSLGLYQAFPEIVTPLDAERGDNIRRDPLTTEEEMAAVIERETRPGDLYRLGA